MDALKVLFVFLAITSQWQAANADAGDVIAGILGAVLILITVCAILGWYSRRGTASQGSGGAPAHEESSAAPASSS